MSSSSGSRVSVLFFLLVVLDVLGRSHEELPGHMQPLGSHMHPEPVRTISHLPSPEEFYEGFVLPQTPLIIEGALRGSAVWKHWQNDQYIRLT